MFNLLPTLYCNKNFISRESKILADLKNALPVWAFPCETNIYKKMCKE